MTIIVAHVYVRDAHNDYFMPEALEECDGKTVVVLKDFDPRQPLGDAKVKYIKGIGLQAKLNMTVQIDIDCLYPAIGFEVITVSGIKKTGLEFVKIRLTSIGLCTSKNVDESIKTIGEQK